MKKRLSIKRIIVPICILFLSVAVTAAFHYIGVKKYESYVSTNATVTNWEIFRSRTFSSRYYYYDYSVDGEPYSGYYSFRNDPYQVYYVKPPLYHVGDTITVWYNPDNPSESTMSKSVILPLFEISVVTVALMMIAFFKDIFEPKKSRLSK